jgi:hypothetical protein
MSVFATQENENVRRETMLTEKEKTEGWISVFDGRTLEGWGVTGNPECWGVEDGCIVWKARGGRYLYTLERYDDFVLSVDFKTEANANSGVFFRWTDLNDPVQTGIEMQILDTYGREPTRKNDCGAIYDVMAPTRNTCKPAGEWNTAVIICDGSLIKVELNNEQIIDMDLSLWTEPGKNPDGTDNKFNQAYKNMIHKGHIGLQDHGGKVWFRNIKLKPLKNS